MLKDDVKEKLNAAAIKLQKLAIAEHEVDELREVVVDLVNQAYHIRTEVDGKQKDAEKTQLNAAASQIEEEEEETG